MISCQPRFAKNRRRYIGTTISDASLKNAGRENTKYAGPVCLRNQPNIRIMRNLREFSSKFAGLCGRFIYSESDLQKL